MRKDLLFYLTAAVLFGGGIVLGMYLERSKPRHTWELDDGHAAVCNNCGAGTMAKFYTRKTTR